MDNLKINELVHHVGYCTSLVQDARSTYIKFLAVLKIRLWIYDYKIWKCLLKKLIRMFGKLWSLGGRNLTYTLIYLQLIVKACGLNQSFACIIDLASFCCCSDGRNLHKIQSKWKLKLSADSWKLWWKLKRERNYFQILGIHKTFFFTKMSVC
jgi:hypothetical protein